MNLNNTELLLKLLFFEKKKKMIMFAFIIIIMCSAQRQVLRCKRRNLGCRRQVFHRKLRNQGCSFTRDLIGEVASRCFPHPTLSLASKQTIKDLKRSQGHQRGGKESGFG